MNVFCIGYKPIFMCFYEYRASSCA